MGGQKTVVQFEDCFLVNNEGGERSALGLVNGVCVGGVPAGCVWLVGMSLLSLKIWSNISLIQSLINTNYSYFCFDNRESGERDAVQ